MRTAARPLSEDRNCPLGFLTSAISGFAAIGKDA
jgi:hypothetical protein